MVRLWSSLPLFCLRSRHFAGGRGAKNSSNRATTVDGTPAMDGEEINNYFIGQEDRFKGVTVALSGASWCPEDFKSRLKLSLQRWHHQGLVRTVWFQVPVDQAGAVPVLAEEGFRFHRVVGGPRRPNGVVMYKWMVPTEEDQVPECAHHMVGVGCFIVNADDEILAVQERFHLRPHWKLPGGYVDPGEDIPAAAVREALEETGVSTEFESIVAFRHGHGMNFDCSDLYFIVALKPLTKEIRMCSRELSRCQWLPLQEYIDSDLVHDMNRLVAKKFLEFRHSNLTLGRTVLDIQYGDRRVQQQVYSLITTTTTDL